MTKTVRLISTKRNYFRDFYSDLSMIGRHFVVFDSAAPQIKRQYTICNAMIPSVYKKLCSLEDLPSVVNEDEQTGIYLTAKNYMSATGVATKLNNVEVEKDYFIKGPMGKGCNFSKEGAHVAFAAGTGVLVYLDIVARLVLQNTGNLEEGVERFGEKFSFHLYASFASRKDAIGLELCEKL